MDSDWSGEEVSCDVAWVLIQGFVSGDSTADGERLMRAHVRVCEECDESYHAAVNTTARIGAKHREERLAEERERRRRELRQMAFEATAPASGRFHRMRTMLYPAFFAFLMVQASRLSLAVEGVSLAPIEGRVEVEEASLAPDEEMRLERGDWCKTGAHGSARLSSPDSNAVLAASSRVLVEAVQPARYRLTRGSLHVEGTCTLSTRGGVIDLAAAEVRVDVGPSFVEVSCDSGEVRLTGPTGVYVVPVGSTERVELAGGVSPDPAADTSAGKGNQGAARERTSAAHEPGKSEPGKKK